MFMLKDDKGRKVIVEASTEARPGLTLLAEVGTTLVAVKEAVVSKTDDINDLVAAKSHIEAEFASCGWGPNVFGYFPSIKSYHNAVRVNCERHYSRSALYRVVHSPPRAKDTFTINGEKVEESTFDKMNKLIGRLNCLDWLATGSLQLQPWDRDRPDRGRVDVGPQQALEMIGIGETVTGESLAKAQGKGEIRPRLWLGDNVIVTMKKKIVHGVIAGLGNKVSVLRSDNSKKATYVYSSVSISDEIVWDEDALANLDPTLAANFAYVLEQGKRVFKASVIIRESAKYPAFPMPGDRNHDERTLTNAPTCECPLCGWPMADFQSRGEFQCSFCRVRGIIAHLDASTVTLLMLRQPAKNQFAVRESKCCANCGLFHFETGRQGKRTTGYCQATNQCVQGYTTCVSADGDEGYWFPRTPATYSKHMTQHVTNLGYGVEDARNTTRRDIRDTIYREDDHKAERKRADATRAAYAAAYAKFMHDLGELSKNRTALTDEFSDEQKTELRKHFQRILDEGC